MRRQHEMETEFINFMAQAYPNVKVGSPQYTNSKLVWASACLAMYVKLGELAKAVGGDIRTNQMLEGIQTEIQFEISNIMSKEPNAAT